MFNWVTELKVPELRDGLTDSLVVDRQSDLLTDALTEKRLLIDW